MGRFKTTKTRSKPNRNKLLKTNSDNNIKYYDKKKQNPNKKNIYINCGVILNTMYIFKKTGQKVTGSTREEIIGLNSKSRSDDSSEETDNLD